MKKLAAVFLTLLFASTASAQVISNPTQNSRMVGLGVQNWQIEDDFNIFINPAQLSNYKNNVYGELGAYTASNPAIGGGAGSANPGGIGTGSQWGGMNMDVSYGGWGVYLGRPYAGPLNAASTGAAAFVATPLTAPVNNRFDLFYATHGMPLGFYLSYASRATETKAGAAKVTDEASEINLGVGGLIMNNMLDVALNLGMPSMEDNDGTTKVQGDAGINIALLGRLHTGMGGNAKLLTTLQILMGDASLKATGGAKLEQTANTIRLDTALNSKPNPSTLLVAGIGIASTSTEGKLKPGGAKSTTSNLTIPVNVAVEHQTFKPVKTRIGLSSAIYNTTECKDSGGIAVCSAAANTKVTTVADGTATMSMGFGWAVADNLMLDAVINQDVLFSGTYVVSGVSETLSTMLSATYRMK
ncbi:MAG TPA: hypothetical protein VIL61_05020 [Nitrospiria bacterium]